LAGLNPPKSVSPQKIELIDLFRLQEKIKDMANILARLRGGDRRSIGNVGEVVAAVRKKPDLLKDLVTGLFDEDPVVRMRAADAMEKISLENPQSIQPFKTELIRLARQAQQQELRWHTAQMIPRLKLTPKEAATVTDIFFDYLTDKSKIVVTFAMQALSDLALKKGAASARMIRAIEKLTRTGSPAIQSRGKKLLPKLKKLSQKE
jgi:HEAT repeat protein